MADLKSHHLLSLAHLLSMGAGSDYVHVTTKSLGDAISRSQQAASAHLLELENAGYVERSVRGKKSLVMVTKKGSSEVRKISSALSKSLDSDSARAPKLSGRISSGVGEGAYYMSLPGYVKQFKTKIGYVPYPGTLNVKLDKKQDMAALDSVTSGEPDALIDGFSDGKRTYGWVKCYECTVGAKRCHLIRLERTHHEEGIVEIISRSNLRRACGSADGTAVKITMARA